MKRRIFEINLPCNFPFIFYKHEGKLLNICDINNPEPISAYHSWSPDRYFTRGTIESNKIVFPGIRMAKECFAEYIKLNLPELEKYADKNDIAGNIFVVKKTIDNEVAVGMAICDAIGEHEIG